MVDCERDCPGQWKVSIHETIGFVRNWAAFSLRVEGGRAAHNSRFIMFHRKWK